MRYLKIDFKAEENFLPLTEKKRKLNIFPCEKKGNF